jgi:hypothetical protein
VIRMVGGGAMVAESWREARRRMDAGVLSLCRMREDCTATGMQAGPETGRVCSSSGWQSAAVARVARIAVEAV